MQLISGIVIYKLKVKSKNCFFKKKEKQFEFDVQVALK